MSLGINVRIDAQRHASPTTHFRSHFIDRTQLGRGFDIEHENVRLQRVADLFSGFPDSREHDPGRWDPGLQRSVQFAAGDDVRPASLSSHQAENGQIGVGLHRKGNDVRNTAKRPIEGPIVLDQRVVAIDVAGRPDFLGDTLDRDVLAMQLALQVLKIMHPASPLPTSPSHSTRIPPELPGMPPGTFDTAPWRTARRLSTPRCPAASEAQRASLLAGVRN